MSDSTRSDGLRPLTLTAAWPRPDICVVHVAGELDMATVPELADYLREQTASCPADLVLDMTEVSLLSALGVALIMSARANELDIHGRLRLLGVAENRGVRRVLALTGVMAVLDVHDSLASLLDSIDRS